METKDKEKILERLEGMKEFEVIYKFSDVARTIKAKSKTEAETKAHENIENNGEEIENETYCYGIEVE